MASNDEQRSATTIFTTAAQSIAARLIANKTTAKFTKAEISTTNLFNQSVTELQVLTSLDNVQQTADINTVTVINDSTVDVNIAVDQTKAPNDYQMNSVGLFAVDGDGKEVLYSVTVLKDPVYVHQDAMGSALGIDLETVVGQSSNVDLSINPAGAVTNEALKVTLADYVKTDDVKSLIPATVIDGSKPADFKEAVTLEKGAVDGAGNAIATAKDLADGDATTLKSAKEYADAERKTINLENQSDLNDITSNGIYSAGDSTNGIKNTPEGHYSWFLLEVNSLSNDEVNGVQKYYDTNNGMGFVRAWNYSNGTRSFTEWTPTADVGSSHFGADLDKELTPGMYSSDVAVVNGPFNDIHYVSWVVSAVGDNVIHQTAFRQTGEVAQRTYWSGAGWGPWKSSVTEVGSNKIMANGNVFVPLAINVATGEICLPDGTAITLSLPGGVKLGDHMLNISATDGLTIDNQAYFTAVADEATAASKAAADPLHNYTTEE